MEIVVWEKEAAAEQQQQKENNELVQVASRAKSVFLTQVEKDLGIVRPSRLTFLGENKPHIRRVEVTSDYTLRAQTDFNIGGRHSNEFGWPHYNLEARQRTLYYTVYRVLTWLMIFTTLSHTLHDHSISLKLHSWPSVITTVCQQILKGYEGPDSNSNFDVLCLSVRHLG